MNNYREIYDKLLSELEVLKIKRGELDNEYSEISADYDNVQDEYDSRMNDIYLKQQDKNLKEATIKGKLKVIKQFLDYCIANEIGNIRNIQKANLPKNFR